MRDFSREWDEVPSTRQLKNDLINISELLKIALHQEEWYFLPHQQIYTTHMLIECKIRSEKFATALQRRIRLPAERISINNQEHEFFKWHQLFFMQKLHRSLFVYTYE